MSSNIPGATETHPYRHGDPVIDQALDWVVVLKSGGEPSPETRLMFETWRDANPDHGKAWDEVAALWVLPEVMIASAKVSKPVAGTTSTLHARRRTGLGRQTWRIGILSAATAALLIIFGPGLYRSMSVNAQADYQTAVGQVQHIVLPDGSRMILDTQSAVAVDFAGTRRNVHLLEGEAWFDVVHDASRPFRVSASFSEVEVKGTSFSVGTDNEADTVKVESGRVQTTHKDSTTAPVFLTAGEMLHASATSLSPIVGYDAESALSWKDGRITLADVSLSQAIETIGKYHDGRIFLTNTSLGGVTISGNYRTDNAEAAIDSVVTVAGGKATHLPGGIIIIH